MRSDNDSWDITTSVGSTALFVAAARALEARKPDPLAVDEYAEVFCCAAGGFWSDVIDGTSTDNSLNADFGEHFITFQAARTRYFDAYFRRAAEAGVRQIVLLAAGLDSRAYRLDWPAGTTVFELDQPQVLEFKRDVLADVTPKARRAEVAIDLRDDWQTALRASGFRDDEPSAWIAEGLLIYLSAAQQERLFEGIDAMASPGSYVAVEESRPMDDGMFRAKVEETKEVEDIRESWWQLIYNEQCAPAAQWFSERGWTAKATALTDYLASVNRAVPDDDAEAAPMIQSLGLVSAVKTG